MFSILIIPVFPTYCFHIQAFEDRIREYNIVSRPSYTICGIFANSFGKIRHYKKYRIFIFFCVFCVFLGFPFLCQPMPTDLFHTFQNFDECGKTVGCTEIPAGCMTSSELDCRGIGQYFYNTTSELMHFKLQFTEDFKWAGFGQNTFEEDKSRMVSFISQTRV